MQIKQHINKTTLTNKLLGWFQVCLMLSAIPGSMVSAQDGLGNAELILEYRREVSMVSGQDNTMRLKIFADGRVSVHYPAFMRRAGEHQSSLTAGELNRLMASMYASGMADFEPETAENNIKRLSRGSTDSGRLRLIRTDQDITHIRIASDNGMHEFAFSGLRGKSSQFPQLQALADLSLAVEQLDRLMRETSAP